MSDGYELTEYEELAAQAACCDYFGAQGFCGQIAEEIQKRIGGEIVAGYVSFSHGHRREHWWVNLNGRIVDPMSEWAVIQKGHEMLVHTEVRRDITQAYWKDRASTESDKDTQNANCGGGLLK